uniref:Protein-lysine methyltransferase METTL21C-like n=1 Tax=Sinocyclocheilus grahami TaxID=75366 RepID=A0A672KBT1_SINGR
SRRVNYFKCEKPYIRSSVEFCGVCNGACVCVCTQAVALCRYLEKNREQVDLLDKAVLELAAGTGLVSIVASLLGAWVTATDLPNVQSNLNFNLSRNTPQEAALVWGQDGKHVIYHHNFLDDLLITMQYFCKPGTTLLWANKVRFQSDLRFIENFKNVFNVTLLEEIPQEEIRIYHYTFILKKSVTNKKTY